jgi:hypothetical protein
MGEETLAEADSLVDGVSSRNLLGLVLGVGGGWRGSLSAHTRPSFSRLGLA